MLRLPSLSQCKQRRVLGAACLVPRANFSALTAVHDVLVGIHDLTHLPWYATIPFSTLLLSIVTLPIAIKSRKNQIKIAALAPIVDANMPRLAQQVRQQKTTNSTPARFPRDLELARSAFRRQLHRRHGVHLLAVLALPALKVPLWLTFSLTLRTMAGAAIPSFLDPLPSEPGFATGGIGWIVDLTAVDGLILLPVTLGLLNLVNVEVNVAARGGRERGRLGVLLDRGVRGVSVLLIPLAAQMPAALCLYWVSSAACTLLQNFWLNRQYPSSSLSFAAGSSRVRGDEGAARERLSLPGVDESSSGPKNDKT